MHSVPPLPSLPLLLFVSCTISLSVLDGYCLLHVHCMLVDVLSGISNIAFKMCTLPLGWFCCIYLVAPQLVLVSQKHVIR